MDNNAVGFKEYKGTKESLLSNTNIKDGDIVFGYDETSDTSYIYHNGVFYGNTSELSEVLPEIYIGDAPPLEESSAVVWYQTNVDIPDSPTEEVSWEDINNKPEFADVAFTGDFNDLVNIPDFNLTNESCTIYTNIEQEDPRAKLSHEQALSNKDAFIKIKASVSSKTGLDITVITVSYDGTETSYKNCFITDTGYSNSGLISATIESAIVVQNINKPYISHIKISQFTNGWEYYEEGWDIPAAYASVNKKYLATSTDVNNHTTTYIGTADPSTLSSKYNLWVDTTDEEVVFRYKDANNAWQVLSTGGNGSIEVDTLLDPTSENPIANKAVYELATVIGKNFENISKDLLKKARTENGLVEGRGFKVNDNLKYYLPNTTTTTDPTVDDTHIIATKADVLSNEVIDSKATVYNLYAIDELTAEQLAANEAALVSVQNREVAIYKVYTNDDTYAIADVKIADGPYLEAYVYVNTPNPTDKQATITRYKYSFNQAGEYLPSDKDVEEVIVPSIAKVNELIGSGGTAAEGVKMYKVYQNPKDADELAANKAAYDAIEAGEGAIYQMNWIIGWITATYALTMMDICGLAFGLTAPADDGSCVQNGNVSLLINSDGSILSFEEKQVYTPSTEKVEEMIANVGGGGGGENNSNSKNIYNIYCELSEDEAEKAKQLESNVIAYNACMNNEDALYTIFLEDGPSIITSVGIPSEEDAMFMSDLTVGTDSAGVLFAFVVTLHADGTSDVKSYNYTLTESNAIVYFLDTTTTEKTIEGVSKILEYISAGKGVTVLWYRGKDFITTCSDVSPYPNGIAVAIQEAGAYATYIIKNTGEITQFLKVGTFKLDYSTVENEKNKEVIGPLSILFSSYGGLTGGLSLSILHKPNYYQVLHTKKVDDSYKMKVILDDNSFGTYTLQSNGILTLDS